MRLAQYGMDYAFLALLFMVSSTGMMLLAVRETSLMGVTLVVHLGFVLARQGDLRGAVSHYRRALEVRPTLFQAASGLAWILATSADASLRDGNEALAWAEHCAQASEYRDPACLDALAAAYAELGDFEQAVHWQNRAVSLLPANRNADLRSRLRLYQSGTPYREPLP